ncbi:MAG: gfo/Idh/MocA family oxidoreductase, partial [Lachnospiraceae bacterium]|nr:gfo/Idh/MocA family oxidoreductase [Lachnospiraceae bacterium]
GLFNTMEAVTDRRGIVFGTDGRIEIENINNFEEFRIYNNQYELEETIPRPAQITGYEYEVLACKRALEEGRIECEEMPHAHTIRVMELLDEIRDKW